MHKCALCLKPVDSLIESHIIPNFILQDSKSKSNGKSLLFENESEKRLIQFDWREPLLCAECEDHFSRNYENPLKWVFFQRPSRKKVVVLSSRKDSTTLLTKYAPNLLNAFLSILWRASVSKQDIYKHINIPDKFCNILRKQVLSRNLEFNISDDCFDVLVIKMTVPTIDNYKGGVFISTPYEVEGMHGKRAFLFTLSRIAVLFILYENGRGRESRADGLRRLGVLKRNRRIVRVPKIPYDHFAAAKDLVAEVLRELASQERES